MSSDEMDSVALRHDVSIQAPVRVFPLVMDDQAMDLDDLNKPERARVAGRERRLTASIVGPVGQR